MNFNKDFIRKLRNRDKEAFYTLYSETGNMIYSYILYKVKGNAATAEDILAEAFCDAIKYAGSLTPDHNIKAWLYRIANSKVCDYFRRVAKDKKIKISKSGMLKQNALFYSLQDSPELSCLINEHKLVIRAAFVKIPLEYQEVLKLKYMDDRSVVEIAMQTGKTAKSVESLLYRGRKIFKKELHKMANTKIYN